MYCVIDLTLLQMSELGQQRLTDHCFAMIFWPVLWHTIIFQLAHLVMVTEVVHLVKFLLRVSGPSLSHISTRLGEMGRHWLVLACWRQKLWACRLCLWSICRPFWVFYYLLPFHYSWEARSTFWLFTYQLRLFPLLISFSRYMFRPHKIVLLFTEHLNFPFQHLIR